MALATSVIRAAPPDLLSTGVIADIDRSSTYNLGPTGLPGRIYVSRTRYGPDGTMTDESRQILVTAASTPASATQQVNDVILESMVSSSSTVPSFSSISRKAIGVAIGVAEKTEDLIYATVQNRLHTYERSLTTKAPRNDGIEWQRPNCGHAFLPSSKPARETEYFTLMSIAGDPCRENVHTGQGFTFMWEGMAANIGDITAISEYLKKIACIKNLRISVVKSLNPFANFDYLVFTM